MQKHSQSNEKIWYVILGVVSILLIFLLVDDRFLFSVKGKGSGEPIGQIYGFQNNVRGKASDQFYWQNVKKNEPLFEGQSLFADQNSQATVLLKDKNRFQVYENSLVILSMKRSDFFLDLRFGEVETTVAQNSELKLRDGDRLVTLKAEGGNGIIRIGKDMDGNLGFVVKGGQVKVTHDGDSVNVNANSPFAMNAKGVFAPLQPVDVKMLTKDGEEFFRPAGNDPFKLEWDAPKADLFQVDICETSDCSTFVVRKKVRSLNDVMVDGYLAPKKYYWKVAARSKNNPLTFESQIQSFDVIIHPEPLLLKPQHQTTLTYTLPYKSDPAQFTTPVEFTWKTEYPISRFNWILASDPELKQPIETGESAETTFTSKPLAAGVYYFRIQATHKDGGLSRKGDYSFTVATSDEPLPEAPRLTTLNQNYVPPRVDSLSDIPGPELKWLSEGPFNRFKVEVASDSNFRDKFTYSSSKKNFRWKELVPGKWFVRVFAVNAEGAESLPSAATSLKVTLQPPKIKPMPAANHISTNNKNREPVKKANVIWNPILTAKNYKLEIQDLVKKKTELVDVPGNQFEYSALHAGEFVFRVRPFDSKNQALTEFSDPESFVYGRRTPIGGPRVAAPRDNTKVKLRGGPDDFLWLVWDESPFSQNFELQISEVPNFSKIYLQKQVDQPRFQLKEALKGGVFYWRVRVVPPDDNFDAEWSKANKFEFLAADQSG